MNLDVLFYCVPFGTTQPKLLTTNYSTAIETTQKSLMGQQRQLFSVRESYHHKLNKTIMKKGNNDDNKQGAVNPISYKKKHYKPVVITA